jgi:leucyl-tRNA synthetase
MRLYEMFMGPLDRDKPWTDEGIQGVHRFLRRVWALYVAEDGGLHPRVVESGGAKSMVKELHKTIKLVTRDLDNMLFNTAIARMMEFVNAAVKVETIDRAVLEKFILLAAPFAPHLAEEVWERLGHGNTLAYEAWPVHDEALLFEDTVEIPVQVNGKLRSKIVMPVDADQATVIAAAKADPKIEPLLAGNKILREVFIPRKMVNLVLGYPPGHSPSLPPQGPSTLI